MTRSFIGVDEPLVRAGLESLLADDASIWQVWDLVDQLDLSRFEASYRADNSGGQPYDPRLMVAAILWCYRLGIRSPYQIAAACRDRIDLRVMLGRRTPSEATVRRFVRNHRLGWQSVVIGTLAVCAKAGLATVAITATDGSPVAARAALSSNRSLASVEASIAALETALAELREQVISASRELAAGADIDAFLEQVCDRSRRDENRLLQRLARLRAARDIATTRAAARNTDPDRLAKLAGWVTHHEQLLTAMIAAQEAKLAARAARGGRGNGGPPPLPVYQCRHILKQQQALQTARDKLAKANQGAAVADPPVVAGPTAGERVNLTAPTSRICKGKRGLTWVQGDNLILTVSSRQLILAADLIDSATDQGALHPSLAHARQACDQAGVTGRMRAHLADAGFASRNVFATPAEGVLLVCPVKEAIQTGRDSNPPKLRPGHEPMAARLATPAGARLYRRRAGMVEPVFAQLFHHGGRNLHFRDTAKHTEIDIMVAAHNAGKYFASQRNTRNRGKSRPLFECNNP